MLRRIRFWLLVASALVTACGSGTVPAPADAQGGEVVCSPITDTACCVGGVISGKPCVTDGKITCPDGGFACSTMGGIGSCAKTCGVDGLGDGSDSADDDATTDVVDVADTADVADSGDAPDGGPCDSFVYIDFPCQSETVCVGNRHVRHDHTMSCEENGYDPKCCSGASCAQGAVEACPDGTLCFGNGWDQGCQPANCGGPGGALCPIGQTCQMPQGSCDPAVTMGVCTSATNLPACVTCESDCAGEATHCEGGKIVQCEEVGGCLKVSAFECPTGKVCVAGGQCVPPTGIAGLPCGGGGACTNGTQCVGASGSSAGLCSMPCAKCSGGTCTPLPGGCAGFGPGGDGQCVGPLAGAPGTPPMCAIPCTAKGECPAGLACQTVPTPFGGPSWPACLPFGGP